MKKVEVVESIPPSGARANDEFARIAEIAKNEYPGQPVIAGQDVPRSRYISLKLRKGSPFRDADGGYIEVNMRNSTMHEDGVRRGTVYFTYHPGANNKNN